MNWLFGSALKTTMVTPERALAGRDRYAYTVPTTHTVLGTPLQGPWPEGTEVLYVGMGCFWGAERTFWKIPGVVTTAVGYQGGFTPFPSYEETCTGHDRAHRDRDDRVRPHGRLGRRPAAHLLGVARPDAGVPAGQRRRHHVPVGDLHHHARAGARRTQHPRRVPAAADAVAASGRSPPRSGPPTTPGTFYYAEGYHQQYLDKNPAGYCGLGGTGVSCPTGPDGRLTPTSIRAIRVPQMYGRVTEEPPLSVTRPSWGRPESPVFPGQPPSGASVADRPGRSPCRSAANLSTPDADSSTVVHRALDPGPPARTSI